MFLEKVLAPLACDCGGVPSLFDSNDCASFPQVPLRHDVESLNKIQNVGIPRFVGNSGMIVVPTASKAAPILYAGSVPHTFNYGTVGAILAKELSRKIRPFIRGVPNPIWDPWGLSSIKPTIRCLQAQTMSAGGNGSPSSEGLFEWSRSVRVAYSAMKEDVMKAHNGHVRPEEAKKIFFRRFCLISCGTNKQEPSDLDARLRCNMPLQNMPEFAETFGCSQGDYMVPAMRCSIL